MHKKIFAIAGLIGLGIVGRLVPHMPNATPITGITFAASKHLGRTWAFVVPLVVMLASDAVIGFYNWRVMLSVYSSFALIGSLSLVVKKYPGVLPVGFALLGASVLFFVVTNFAVWIFSPWYAKNIEGLFYCYALGLPFLRNMMLGDGIYGLALLVLPTSVKLWLPQSLNARQSAVR